MASNSICFWQSSVTSSVAAVIVFFIVLNTFCWSNVGFVQAQSTSKNGDGEQKTSTRSKGLGSFNLNGIQHELANAASSSGGIPKANAQQSDMASSRRNITKSEDSQLDEQLMKEAELLSRKIDIIVNTELGYKAMQNSFDSMGYIERSPDENELVKQLSLKLKIKIKKFLSLLSFNRGVVENLFRSHSTGLPIVAKQECCALPAKAFTYDELFQANISCDTACDRRAPVTSPNAFNPVRNLTQVFKRHLLRYPNIKWQYFSSEDGTHAIFPATSYTAPHATHFSCSHHWDCRNQQLYATTVRPQAKNVVIVIDRGSAVGELMLNIAKKATQEALSALSPGDKVSVISVGSAVQTCHIDTCFNNYMASATQQTKQQLFNFLESIKSERGPTNHTQAILKAFEVLGKSVDLLNYNRSTIDSVIVYISAGHTRGTEETKAVVNTVITGNRKLLNRVIVMTYALVQEGRTGLEELAFLRDLAEQDNGTSFQHNDIPDLPARQKGVMTVLNQISNLPSTVGRFYTILPHDPVSKPVFSLPYIDQTGGGLILSISQTCLNNDKLIGIVGIDINMADLLEDITYFEKGEQSYAFLINNQGYTIMHKSLARPLYVSQAPMYTDITHFESSPGFEQVRDSMMRGESGTVLLTKSGNDSSLVKYTWCPIEQAPLSIAVVLLEADFTIKYLRPFSVLPESNLYHRLDLVPSDTMCAHFKQLATKDASTLMLSPGGFESPFEHMSQDETKLAVQAYMAFLNDDTDLIASPGIKAGIKNSVALTVSIESVWLNQIKNSPLNDYIVRRYIATTSGVLRMHPGTLLEKNHDPSKRAWYKAAVKHAGQTVVSSPYLDVGGAGYIITISRAIFQGKNSGKHENTDRVVGVMAIDFTLQFLYKQLQYTLSICTKKFIRCFIMDSKGYLLAHPHLVSPHRKGPIENRHITHQEVLVSNDMLYHKTFVHKYQCNSYTNRTMQRFYRFNTSIAGILTNLYHGGDCNKYRITHIKGTNAFVGVVNDTCNVDTLFCPCSMVDRMCLNCKRMEQTECECPCECVLQMDPCHNKLVNTEDRNPSCVTMEEPSQLPKKEVNLVKDLPQCYDSKCHHRKTYEECFGVLDCEWCVYDHTGKDLLASPHCAVQRECFNGVIGAESPYGDEYYLRKEVTSMKSGSGAHVGPVAGALLGIIMAFALVTYFYRQHIHNAAQRQELAQNISDTSVRMSQGEEGDEDNGDTGNNPPPHPPYGQPNIMLAAIQNPSPYHQRIRHGIRVWRRGGGTPSESDHGYSTMTPHEDSEYHYVEPEPIVVEPEQMDMEHQPLQLCSQSLDSPELELKTALLNPASIDDAPLRHSPPQTVVPKIDPPPQTILPRRTHVKVQVHMVDTFC